MSLLSRCEHVDQATLICMEIGEIGEFEYVLLFNEIVL